MFWDLPHACVIGILNGMEDPLGEVAAAAAAADPDAFFARKAAARLAFQEAKGLQVGMCVFGSVCVCVVLSLLVGGYVCVGGGGGMWGVHTKVLLSCGEPKPAISPRPHPRRLARTFGCWCSWGASHTRWGVGVGGWGWGWGGRRRIAPFDACLECCSCVAVLSSTPTHDL